MQGVFAGGDCITGPSAVIEAIDFDIRPHCLDKYRRYLPKEKEYMKKAEYEPDENPWKDAKYKK